MAHMRDLVVFFDLMGTLASTKTDREAHEALMKSLCNRYGLKDDIASLTDEYERIVSAPFKARDLRWKVQKNVIISAFKKILIKRNVEFDDEDYDWFYNEYLEKHRMYVRLYPGVVESLEKIAEINIRMGIISDADRYYLDFQIDALDIKKFFYYMVCSEDVGFRKPHPRIFERAMEVCGRKGRDIIMVGDSVERDMMGAKLSGMNTILFDPERKVEDVRYADFIIADIRRLPFIVKEYTVSP